MTRPSLIFSICLFTYTFFVSTLGYGYVNSSLTSALIIGTNTNGDTLFLCRTSLFNEEQVGITKAGSNQCTITYEGKIYALTRYTIPNQSEFGHYIWASTTDKAIKVGQDSQGKSLFLCQSNLNGHFLPGVTWAGYNYCNIIYQNKEVITVITHVLSTM